MAQDDTTLVGIVGQRWSADVSSRGAVTGGPSPTAGALIRWMVAADDRWHDPEGDATVRQRRVDGTPVVETRVRIPDGDAVQRVWAAADAGGTLVIEFENESPRPIAIAVAGVGLRAGRSPSALSAGMRPPGLDLPDDAMVLPLGHRTTTRVVRGAADPDSVAPAANVARGWLQTIDRASRLDLPEVFLVESLVAARSDLLLAGPVSESADPVGFLLDVGELVRLGDDADGWLPSVAEVASSLGRDPDPEVDVALTVMARVAVAAGDERAEHDTARLLDRRARRLGPGRGSTAAPAAPVAATPLSEIRRGASVGRFVAEVERLLVNGRDILPRGFPRSWHGVGLEAHGLRVGLRSGLGFAVRWHGARPAIIWEQTGPPGELSASVVAPDWRSADEVGEALWPEPPERAGSRLRVGGATAGDPTARQ